jgi:hypothetical protein
MAVEFESVNDQARWEKAVKNIGQILGIPTEKVVNYLVLVYDGSPELKADTDISEVPDVIAMVTVFLEHVTGKTVRFEDNFPDGGFINDSGEVDNR